MAMLSSLVVLIYTMVHPAPGQISPVWSRPIDWLVFGSPIVLLVVLAISSFLARFAIFMHVTAVFAVASIPVMLLQEKPDYQFLLTPLTIWVLMYCHAWARRREKERLAKSAQQQVDPDHIDRDTRCIYCHYNLRGLTRSGRCPECGRPVVSSLAPEPVSLTHPEWFGTIMIGMCIFTIGALLQIVLDLLVERTRTFAWNPEVATYLYFVAAIFSCVGPWLMTKPEKPRNRYRGFALRYMVRASAMTYAVISWGLHLSSLQLRIQFMQNKPAILKMIPQSLLNLNIPILSGRGDVFEILSYVILEWLMLVYLYLLATRMPSKAMCRMMISAGGIMLCFYGMSVLQPIVSLLYTSVMLAGDFSLADLIRYVLDYLPELMITAGLITGIICLTHYRRRMLREQS